MKTHVSVFCRNKKLINTLVLCAFILLCLRIIWVARFSP